MRVLSVGIFGEKNIFRRDIYCFKELRKQDMKL